MAAKKEAQDNSLKLTKQHTKPVWANGDNTLKDKIISFHKEASNWKGIYIYII